MCCRDEQTERYMESSVSSRPSNNEVSGERETDLVSALLYRWNEFLVYYKCISLRMLKCSSFSSECNEVERIFQQLLYTLVRRAGALGAPCVHLHIAGHFVEFMVLNTLQCIRADVFSLHILHDVREACESTTGTLRARHFPLQSSESEPRTKDMIIAPYYECWTEVVDETTVAAFFTR